MFNWFLSWFSKKQPNDLYHPKERLIYSYFNGIRVVLADPMVLYRRIMDKGAELSIDVKVAGSIHSDARKAEKAVANKIRELFTLKPLTNEFEVEGTLGDIEAMNLWDHFMSYCQDLKKNSSLLRTTLRPTALRATSNEGPATSNTVDSGSTDVDSSTVIQEPPPLA